MLYWLVTDILKPIIGEELIYKFMSLGFHLLPISTNISFDHGTVNASPCINNLYGLWDQNPSGFLGLFEKSFDHGLSWSKEETGQGEDNWSSGYIQRVIISHSISLKKSLDQVFNRVIYPLGSDPNILCQTTIFSIEPHSM